MFGSLYNLCMDETTPLEEITELNDIIFGLKHQIRSYESKNAALRGEIEAFAKRYRRSVHHIYAKVEDTRAKIKRFHDQRRSRFLHGTDEEPRYSWERKQRFAPPDKGKQKTGILDEDLLEKSENHLQEIDLKQLYRKLARRFHPDLVTDPAERDRRTRLMIIINEAYSKQDVATLVKIDRDDEPSDADASPPLTLEERKLRELRNLRRELELQLEDLKIEHTDLMLDPLLDLKIEEKLARAQGRNLLKEVADELANEYRTLNKQLDNLRRGG